MECPTSQCEVDTVFYFYSYWPREIYFFDFGHERYGDCLFVTKENKSILIDGAHPDDDSRIVSQLRIAWERSTFWNHPFKIVEE